MSSFITDLHTKVSNCEVSGECVCRGGGGGEQGGVYTTVLERWNQSHKAEVIEGTIQQMECNIS